MSGIDKTFAPASAALQPQRGTSTLTYGKLRQQNPEYDAERMGELHDLHAGGYQIARRASKFLPPLVNEHEARCAERRQGVAYLNYFGQLLEQFTSDLFAQPLTIQPPPDADNTSTPGVMPDEDFYNAFETDADMEGTSFVDLMKVTITNALVQRTAFVCLDAAADPVDEDDKPKTKADEEASGLGRIYAYSVSPRNVIDWRLGKGKRDLDWAIVQEKTQDRKDPEAVRETVTETFTVWRMDREFAVWQRHVFEYDPKKPPQDTDTATDITDGKTSFRRLPILRMQLPKGLWMGNKAGPPQKEHWQRRSALVGAENRSLVAIPYVKRGPEIGAIGEAQPSDTQEDPNRGRDPVGKSRRQGWVEIGADDELGFAEPAGTCYALTSKELDELKDEIFRVTHQMAASVRPSAGSLGRSAASKQQDGKATALVLKALGHEIRQFGIRVYRAISEARGEDVAWIASGLDNYEVIDRDSVLEEAISIPQVTDAIPSETFHRIYVQQIGEKLLTGIDPRTLGTMKDELEKGIKSQRELTALTLDAKKDEIQNPTPPPPPVVPGVKAPTPPGTKAPVPPTPGKKAA
jgi:hypothetical protein